MFFKIHLTQHSKILHKLPFASFQCNPFSTCLTAQNDQGYTTSVNRTRFTLTQKKLSPKNLSKTHFNNSGSNNLKLFRVTWTYSYS